MKPSPRLAGVGAATAATPRRLSTPFARTDGSGRAASHATSISETSATQPQIPSAHVKLDDARPAGARRRTEKGYDACSISGLFVHSGNESAALSEQAAGAKEKRDQIERATKKQARALLAKSRGWQPEDEEAVLAERRQAQEKEWRKLLRKPGQEGGFGKSSGSVYSHSEAPTATTAYTASRIAAGVSADEARFRIERNGCFAHAQQCFHYGTILENAEPEFTRRIYARKVKTTQPEEELPSSFAQGNKDEEDTNRLKRMSWLVSHH
mmetsp:Transcript_16591/g.29031  ORF Transcript_16591/g.29031 Transcript_16591/m.29031 type:complete len:268 (+) Transcript_16591:42-845(+)|eukprot:CAMPEP_0197663854 /NCGR_PEP_ID=MMETSP1338-20131121/58277_1 /TAXON_ID=43686 ORGANISM="Pelagodinium beii, Strain RCC1491" /NCGR_SAMPLE_ID=MMETSP1338 /ASSEMBLY_ACC=CAM_ASM_000754 /LENGTH=267 /DNA_ID=CAMNT_0043242367 /DNA_START=42 /DNA_END=845 /DNA_ORIENTATION=-